MSEQKYPSPKCCVRRELGSAYIYPKQMNIRLTEKMSEVMVALCKETERDMSHLLRYIVKDWMRSNPELIARCGYDVNEVLNEKN